jgi:hypothetical protein
MTFEQAHTKLNVQQIDDVAAEMEKWHPAVLGAMLKAVYRAYKKRVLAPHQDFLGVLRAISKKEGI